jgi:hypothetical protein
MSRIKLPRWWAYLDDTGKIRVKKYTTDKAIQNCEQLPFCKGIFDPFEAADYNHACKKIMMFLDEQSMYEKKVKG